MFVPDFLCFSTYFGEAAFCYDKRLGKNYLCKYECISIPTEVFTCKQVYTNKYVYKNRFPSLLTLFLLFFSFTRMRIKSIRWQ